MNIDPDIFQPTPRNALPLGAKRLERIRELLLEHVTGYPEFNLPYNALVYHIQDIVLAIESGRQFPSIDSYFTSSAVMNFRMPNRSEYDKAVTDIINILKKEGYFEHKS